LEKLDLKDYSYEEIIETKEYLNLKWYKVNFIKFLYFWPKETKKP
jgi:hypothetical protein